MKLDLKYYLSIFLRRSPYFVIVAALFASVGISLAVVLPPEYEARAVLLVEAEQIPENLAASTVRVQAGESLRIIEQRLTSRQVMLDIANRLGLFPPDENGERPSATGIVNDMRGRTTFSSSTRGGATILTISFRAKNAVQSAEVANEFVTRVLQENVELRTAQAGDTLEFFTQEVERLGRELDAKSVELINFQNAAGIALPDNLGFLRSRLDDLTKARNENQQTLVVLENQRRRLIEIFEITGGPARSPLEQELADQRSALSDALLVYSEQNPRVALLRARVNQLEEQLSQQIEAQAAASGELAAQSEAGPQQRTEREIRFEAEIQDIDRRINTIRDEIERTTEETPLVEQQLNEAASNGVVFNKLQRDFDNIQGQYNQAVARLSVAATGERIELLAKGQRISVIEQAIVPENPNKPNRTMIAATGVGAGMVGGLALVVLLEFLNRSIRRPIELTNRLGVTPFAVLPYVKTRPEIMFRRVMIIGTVCGLVILLPLGLFAVHSLAFPLDSIIERLFNRVGFSVIG